MTLKSAPRPNNHYHAIHSSNSYTIIDIHTLDFYRFNNRASSRLDSLSVATFKRDATNA